MRRLACIVLIIGMVFLHVVFTGADDGPKKQTFLTPEDMLKAEQAKSPIGGTDGWELEKEKDGVKVFTRAVKTTPIRSFKGVTVIKADLNAVIGLLSDDNYFPEWMYLVEKSRIVRKVTETEFYRYTINRPKWPASVRDAVSLNWWSQDPETCVVTGRFIGAPDYLPEEKGFVRVPMLVGAYTLSPLDNGNIKIEYETIVDPAGWVPTWLVNWTVTFTPYLTLTNMKEQLSLGKYKDAKISWLKIPPQK